MLSATTRSKGKVRFISCVVKKSGLCVYYVIANANDLLRCGILLNCRFAGWRFALCGSL